MGNISSSDKIIFGIAIFVIVLFTAYGFYLIDAEPKIASLAASGHNHMLSFAYGAILFGLVMRLLAISEGMKKLMAWWMSTTYLGPLALVWAGITGNASMLSFTSPVFMGSFVLLWVWLGYYLLKNK